MKPIPCPSLIDRDARGGGTCAEQALNHDKVGPFDCLLKCDRHRTPEMEALKAEMLIQPTTKGKPAGIVDKLKAAVNVIEGVAHAAASVARTTAGIDVATPEQFESRLSVCRQCPGHHAVWRRTEIVPQPDGRPTAAKAFDVQPKNEDDLAAVASDRRFRLFTCGPMLESLKRAGEGTCGCILDLKAKDTKEDCPFGYWPTIGKSDQGEKI